MTETRHGARPARPERRVRPPRAGRAAAQGLGGARGLAYWSAVNNTQIGVWYTAAAFGFMLFAGVLR